MPFNKGDGVKLIVDHTMHVSAGGKALRYEPPHGATGVNYDLLGYLEVNENEIGPGAKPQGGGIPHTLQASHTFTCRPVHLAVVEEVLGEGRYRIRVHVRRLYPKDERP